MNDTKTTNILLLLIVIPLIFYLLAGTEQDINLPWKKETIKYK